MINEKIIKNKIILSCIEGVEEQIDELDFVAYINRNYNRNYKSLEELLKDFLAYDFNSLRSIKLRRDKDIYGDKSQYNFKLYWDNRDHTMSIVKNYGYYDVRKTINFDFNKVIEFLEDPQGLWDRLDEPRKL